MAASPAMEKLHKMVATSAIHDGERDVKSDHTGVCHPGTREEHLENLKVWADSVPPETRLEWVHAIAGTGKTAMFRSFCIELEEKSGFPSISFFAWEGDGRRNTLKHFPATITYQLCRRIPALIPHIEKAINEDPLLLQSAFKKQMEKLVIRPLLDCSHTIKDERHLIIVVDGLDELDAKGQAEMFDFIPHFLSRLSSFPISLLVSSRPDPQIVGAFNHPKLASITRACILGTSDADIRKFLDDKFEDIILRHPYLLIEHGVKWPSQEKRETMVRQSSGLFIWPTVAIGHIDKVEKGLGHNKRLEQVLSSADPKPWVGSPLDKLYRAILEAHAPEDRTSFEFWRFKRRLALICVIDLGNFVAIWGGQKFDWSDALVRALFGESLDDLWDSVAGLSSLLSPRKPLSHRNSPTPGVLHHSLRDFTFNKARCGEELYYSSEENLHAEIACKVIKSFDTRQAFQVKDSAQNNSLSNTFAKSAAELGVWFIALVGRLLEIHLKEAGVKNELGCCMDDITLDIIPPSWPLVTQVFVAVALFGDLYRVAQYPVSELLISPTLY